MLIILAQILTEFKILNISLTEFYHQTEFIDDWMISEHSFNFQ